MPHAGLLALLAFALGLPCATSATTPKAPDAASESYEETATRCLALRTSDPAGAISLAESTLAGGDIPADSAIKLHVCVAKGAAYIGDIPRVDAAVSRIDELLKLNPMPPDFSTRALSNAGAALHTIGRINEALDFYARTYEVAAQSDSVAVQVSTLVNIASIYSAFIGAYAEAETYYAKAAAISEDTGITDPLLPYNRGLNFLRMNRDDQALASFINGEPKIEKAGNKMILQRIRSELIALRPNVAGLAAIGPALQAAADEQMAQPDPPGAALTLLRLSKLELASGDANAALKHAMAAKETASGGGFPIEYRDAAEAEVAAYVALEQWPKAMSASTALHRLEIDRMRKQQLAGLAGLQARLEDTRTEQALASMTMERQQEALRLQGEQRLRKAVVAALLMLALLGGAFLFYQRRVNRKLHLLSTVDALTGLLNRRAGEASLRELAVTSSEGDRRSVVYLIDVDLFKEFNDRFGHSAGDEILSATAGRLRAACRPGDVVTRWGGEEFLVACEGLDADGAAMMAERLRTAAHVATPELHDAAPLSVSIGFTCVPFLPDAPRSEGWQASVVLADRALYASKKSGRNTWVGLWGIAGRQAALDSVLADPEGHVKRGDFFVLSATTTVQWPSSHA